jgi:hypothetical protein
VFQFKLTNFRATGGLNSATGGRGPTTSTLPVVPALPFSGDATETPKLDPKDVEDVKGSLKVHIKLNLEVDIRIIAKLKGDIAIGIL